MKSRIEELAEECGIESDVYGHPDRVLWTQLHKFAQSIHNEALGLAAKECDYYAEQSSNPMNFSENCAEAIRKLKCS